MNSKKLMVAFVAVSIAALIVSSFAVFAVARTYSASLARDDCEAPAEDIAPPEISASVPAESEPPELTSEPETEEESAETTSPPETTAEVTEAEVSVEETTASETEVSAFTLTLSDGRLVILSPEGEVVYERIVDPSSLHPKDRDALFSGMDFPGLDEAMSAVYDLIS